MKLLFAIKFLHDAPGGAEKVLCTLCNKLVERGHDVSILSYDKKGAKPFYQLNPRIKLIQLNLFAKKTTLLNTIERMRGLRKKTIEINPDIVIGFMHSMFVPLAFALIFLKKKIIASEHIVIEHYTKKKFEFLLLILSSFFVRYFSVINSFIKSKYPYFIRNKMVEIPNPISQSNSKKCNPKDLRSKKLILAIGRLDEQKNHKLLIDAFSLISDKYKNWNLTIYGKGILYFELKKQINALKLKDRVFIKSPIKKIGLAYESASFKVLPSNYESFGLVIAESMSYGLPVIAFEDCPNTQFLIEDKINGLLVAGNSYEEKVKNLAKDMDSLIVSEDLFIQLSKNALATNLLHFDINTIVQKWENLLKKAMIS